MDAGAGGSVRSDAKSGAGRDGCVTGGTGEDAEVNEKKAVTSVASGVEETGVVSVAILFAALAFDFSLSSSPLSLLLPFFRPPITES